MIQAIPTSKSWLAAEGAAEIQAIQIPLFLLGCFPETNEYYEFLYYLQEAL